VAGSVPPERHLLGIATQRTSRKISGAYQDVLKWARTTESVAALFTRIDARGIASKDMRDFVATTRRHLVANGIADDDTIWRLLRRMLILKFDFEATAPIAKTYGYALTRIALADEDVGRAEALWSRLDALEALAGADVYCAARSNILDQLAARFSRSCSSSGRCSRYRGRGLSALYKCC